MPNPGSAQFDHECIDGLMNGLVVENSVNKIEGEWKLNQNTLIVRQ